MHCHVRFHLGVVIILSAGHKVRAVSKVQVVSSAAAVKCISQHHCVKTKLGTTESVSVTTASILVLQQLSP